jgi:hypothetical protein
LGTCARVASHVKRLQSLTKESGVEVSLRRRFLVEGLFRKVSSATPER